MKGGGGEDSIAFKMSYNILKDTDTVTHAFTWWKLTLCFSLESIVNRDKENTDDNEADERTIPKEKDDPEADLRALLYGQEPVDSPAGSDDTTEDADDDDTANQTEREMKLRKYELEMDLVEELLRDLENFDLEQ